MYYTIRNNTWASTYMHCPRHANKCMTFDSMHLCSRKLQWLWTSCISVFLHNKFRKYYFNIFCSLINCVKHSQTGSCWFLPCATHSYYLYPAPASPGQSRAATARIADISTKIPSVNGNYNQRYHQQQQYQKYFILWW